MVARVEIGRAWRRYAASGFLAVAILAVASFRSSAQAWPSYSHDAQHTCQSSVASMLPQAIRWSTPVDLDPQYASNGALYTHYGSPLITSLNLVLVPVKTAANGGLRLDAHQGTNGSLFWSITSDYAFPHFGWIPPFGPVLTAGDTMVAMPGAGGTLLVRTTPNSGHGSLTRIAFFGLANYQEHPGAFNTTIQICTPITCDASNNFYFGYVSTGAAVPGYLNGIPSGLAKVSSSGSGTFSGAAALCGDATMVKVSYNCAPAVSADGSTVYVAVNNIPVAQAGNFGSGYLCKLNSADLSRQASVFLNDPRAGSGAATMTDDSTASPTIGPDDDVYFGVLEHSVPSNNDRGWMLHFSADLSTVKTPGAFGWDDTASIVPARAVPSYTGTSSYLILTKYNNYAGIGTGNGQNKLAVLDPNTTESDPVTGATVMKEVLTILGLSADPNHPGGVREWCINSAAIDSTNKCAVVNSEDGHVYRWSFMTNTLSPAFPMAAATGEAYTPTLIGPDGAVYAINNAELYCCQSGGG